VTLNGCLITLEPAFVPKCQSHTGCSGHLACSVGQHLREYAESEAAIRRQVSVVASLQYSLDGTHYRRYIRSLLLHPSTSKIVHAIADDRVGNRRVKQYRLKAGR